MGGVGMGVVPDDSGEYMLMNETTIAWLNVSGSLDLGKIITALFNVTPTHLTLHINNAGFFQISTKSTTSGSVIAIKAALANPGSSKIILPSSPLAEVGNDLSLQQGLCFWADIEFDKISLFNSLITVGYGASTKFVIYGLVGKFIEGGVEKENTILYAQLPQITLLNILTFGGLAGREGVRFKYDLAHQKQLELNGNIGIDIFGKSFSFDGDLVVNNLMYRGVLELSTSSPTSSLSKVFNELSGQELNKNSWIEFNQLVFKVKHTFAITATDPKTKEKTVKTTASTDMSLVCSGVRAPTVRNITLAYISISYTHLILTKKHLFGFSAQIYTKK